MELMTPYGAAKIVNAVLETYGLKSIPPQMIYNYVGKGYIASTLVDGKKKVSMADLQAWTIKYLAKKGIALEVQEEEVSEEEKKELEIDADILSKIAE